MRKCNYKEKELEVLSKEFGRGEMYWWFHEGHLNKFASPILVFKDGKQKI